MERKNDRGLYLGLTLVVLGIVFFLDLNGWIPNNFFGQYVNIILGVILLVAYFKTKNFLVLMTTSFFLTNGIMIVLDSMLVGYNYLAAMFIIPGVMFLVAFWKKRSTIYIIPGAILFWWGIYILLVTVGVLSGYLTIIGGFFILTGAGFLTICLWDSAKWAGIISLALGIMGVLIIAMGLGPISRNILFQIISIALVIGGILIIVKAKLTERNDSNDSNKGDE